MGSQGWMWLGISLVVVTAACAVGARLTTGLENKIAMVGTIAALVGVFFSAVQFAQAQDDRTKSGERHDNEVTAEMPARSAPQPSPTRPAATPERTPAPTNAAPPPTRTKAPVAEPASAETSLPPNSPLRERRVSMDDICAKLTGHRPAWLPGQQRPDDYDNRVIDDQGAAFNWSCEKDGPHLTRDQISEGCQIWYPGSVAYTYDRNNAYSWICI